MNTGSGFLIRKTGGFERIELIQIVVLMAERSRFPWARQRISNQGSDYGDSHMKHARKQNYVDSQVQGALLKRIVLHWFLYFVVAGLAIVLLQAMLSGPQGDPLVSRIMQEASEFTLVGLILICIFPAFLLDTVRFSNRFVGPVGRLRRYLRHLGQDGNTERLNFRGGDFWSEMAEEYNVVAKIVEDQQTEIARLKNQLRESGVSSRA